MNLMTPKKVAKAIGVSESSMKRWCDRGLVEFTRTAGGHRRIAPSAVIRFLQQSKHRLIDSRILGLPEGTGQAALPMRESSSLLGDALVAGDIQMFRKIVFDQFIAGTSLSKIFDQLIAPSFHRIGDLWQCGDVDVYHERRGCEICLNVFREMETFLPEPTNGEILAIGGTPAKDPYSIPSRMVELVLRENGWKTISLGSQIPFVSFANAVREYRPQLVWLSVSSIEDREQFLNQYQQDFYDKVDPSIWIVVGGRALVQEVRSRMQFAAYCDTLQQLENFSTRLIEQAKSAVASKPNNMESNQNIIQQANPNFPTDRLN